MTRSGPNTSNLGAELETEFFDIVESLTDQFQEGISVDLSALAKAYPQFADRLARIIPTLRLMSDFASFSTSLDGKFGDYRIIRELGRGGMGVVYEAEQVSLSRRVALKILPYAAFLDQRSLERFKNEARAAAALQHPRIVPIYTVGLECGVHFYTMQYIDGHTLADASPLLQSKNGQTNYAKVAQIGIQIAEALEFAHEVGVIHRDVKPANLLIDSSGNTWLADFGLAQLKGDRTLSVTGDVVGTLRYMSPEQASGKNHLVDHRTDIYSLGITLYELLTCREFCS